MLSELDFAVEIGPLRDGDFVAARWVGTERGPDGYWTGTSSG
jgi:hypothetical protein